MLGQSRRARKLQAGRAGAEGCEYARRAVGHPVTNWPDGCERGVPLFEAWGWLFREQPIEDYGIDAHVEPLDGPEQPSRQLLALQE